MKIVEDEANWFIQPYDHTTKKAYLFVMKTPIVSAWQKTRSTKMKIPLNKSQVRELIQELQEIEKLLEEVSELSNSERGAKGFGSSDN